MPYVSTQAIFYLVAFSHCIQRISKVEKGNDALLVSEAELNWRVIELERDARGFEQKYDLLAMDNVSLVEAWSVLESKVDAPT